MHLTGDDIDRSIFPDFTLTSVTNVLCHSCEPKVQEACARCLKNLLKHGLGASPVIPEVLPGSISSHIFFGGMGVEGNLAT